MAETIETTAPLAFAASFPPEDRFVATAAEIAGRLAASCGCSAEAAEQIRGAVQVAFREILASSAPDGACIDLTLVAHDGVFDADVASGGAPRCHCSRPRTA